MNLVTIPSLTPPERDPGVVDVTPDTLADREQVASIRDFLAKRDRNASRRPRASTPNPDEAA